jgi:hypothetical protein
MKDKRKLLIILAGAVICLIAARLAVSVTDRGRTYEVEPWITTPEYRTDAGRAIDAYERLMERYMDLAETHLVDSQQVSQRLDSIDTKLDDISKRLARIEKAIGIDPNTNPSPSKASGVK